MLLRAPLACFALLACIILAAPAHADEGFAPDSRTAGPAPIPLSEQGLPSLEAAPLKTVNSERHILEGPVFDREGNLYFCDVTGGKVQKLTPENELSDLVVLDGLAPSGLAFGPDGRLFMAVTNPERTAGSILAVSGSGEKPEVIVSAQNGYLPNDLVFDSKGGLYFSDCKGTSTVAGGGIIYRAPDGKLTTVIPDMAQANGVALSPDDTVIWATEYAREQLHRTTVKNATEIVPFRSHVPYRFTGRGPDSMRVDADGNVYVAMMSQGRVLIFNPNGFPIGQILLPGRDEGRNLLSTSLAIHPEKKEVRIVASNAAESDSADAVIFTAPSFAPGLAPAK